MVNFIEKLLEIKKYLRKMTCPYHTNHPNCCEVYPREPFQCYHCGIHKTFGILEELINAKKD